MNCIYKEYNKNETMRIELDVSNHKINGPYIIYDKDGKIEFEAFYTNNKLEGTYNDYKKNIQGIYKNGIPIGEYRNGIVKRQYNCGYSISLYKENPYKNNICGDIIEYSHYNRRDCLLYRDTYENNKIIDSYLNLIAIEDHYPIIKGYAHFCDFR